MNNGVERIGPRIVLNPLGRTPEYRLLADGEDEDVRALDYVREMTGFILDRGEFRGTAFIAEEPFAEGHKKHFYLVTAKHNVERMQGRDCKIRFNRLFFSEANDHSDSVTLSIGTNWYFHPSGPETADVAVQPFELPMSMFYRGIPVKDAGVRDEDFRCSRIMCGDEGFAVGLFAPLPGDERNVPVVRTIHLAAVDYFGKPLRINALGFPGMEAYLIEVRSIGGLSGSPVFIRAGGVMGRTEGVRNRQQLLLGLVHGHWDVQRGQLSKLLSVEDDEVNSGIAAVTPAKKIVETLDHPELVAMRKRIEEAQKKSRPTTKTDYVDDATADDALPPMTPEELIRRAVNTPPLKNTGKKPAKRKGR